MKLPGILLILLCCAGTGMYAAAQVRNQVKICQKLVLFLEDCQTYMQYQHLNLEELFRILAGKQEYRNLDFIRNLAEHPELPPETRWHLALQDSGFPEEIREILGMLGEELGKSDLAGQTAVLTLCRTQIQGIAVRYQSACQQKSRLYQSLGWLGGAMLTVLFL